MALPWREYRWQILVDRWLFFLLLAVLGLAATRLGAVDPSWNPIIDCLTFLLAIVSISEGLLTKSFQVNQPHLLVPLIGIAAFAFLQSLQLGKNSEPLLLGYGTWQAISVDPYESRLFALRLLAVVLTLALLLRYATTKVRLAWLVYLIIGIGVLSAIFGLAKEAFNASAQTLTASTVFGQFENRNHFAYLMSMVTGLTLGLTLSGGLSRRLQILLLIMVVPVWVALILTRSRAAILALGAQVLFLALMFVYVHRPSNEFFRRRLKIRQINLLSGKLITASALIVCLATVLWLSIIWVGGDKLQRRLESVPIEFSNDGRTGGNRIDIWRATWRSIVANPVAGTGLADFKTSITKYHDASGKWTPEQAHNDYLELTSGGGLVAAILGGCFLVGLIRSCRTRLRSLDRFRSAACMGALAGIFAIAVHSLFDYGLHINTNAMVCTALIAIATVDVKDELKVRI